MMFDLECENFNFSHLNDTFIVFGTIPISDINLGLWKWGIIYSTYY